MQQVTREYVQEKIENGTRVSLIEVLGSEQYDQGHLPHAINIPLDDEFETSASLAVPNRDEPIVVYCLHENCDASAQAAKQLEAMGYRKVMEYAGGKKDWSDAGLRLVPSETRSSDR